MQERVPVWLYVAAVVLIALTLVPMALDPQLDRALALVLAGLLTVFLLRGSRVAWVGSLIGAIGQPIEALVTNSLGWADSLSVLLAVCLVMPSSRRYVWHQKHRRPRFKSPRSGWLEKAREFPYVVLAYFGGWEAEVKEAKPLDSGRYRSLLIRTGCCTLGLLILVTATYNWQQTQPSRAMNIIANVTWTLYAVFQVALIALALFYFYRHWSHGRGTTSVKERD
jgi:hypothetical protein